MTTTVKVHVNGRYRATVSDPRLSVLDDRSAGISASVLERAFG